MEESPRSEEDNVHLAVEFEGSEEEEEGRETDLFAKDSAFDAPTDQRGRSARSKEKSEGAERETEEIEEKPLRRRGDSNADKAKGAQRKRVPPSARRLNIEEKGRVGDEEERRRRTAEKGGDSERKEGSIELRVPSCTHTETEGQAEERASLRAKGEREEGIWLV